MWCGWHLAMRTAATIDQTAVTRHFGEELSHLHAQAIFASDGSVGHSHSMGAIASFRAWKFLNFLFEKLSIPKDFWAGEECVCPSRTS